VKSAAIKLYRKRKTEILEGKKLPDKLRAVVRISDLAPALLRDYQMNDKRSYEAAERRLRLHVLPFFGAMIANEVGTDDLDRYVDGRRREGAEKATINREIAALKRIYNLAHKSGPLRCAKFLRFPT
jgi:Phage integrase, N-terminal SAM-like domain